MAKSATSPRARSVSRTRGRKWFRRAPAIASILSDRYGRPRLGNKCNPLDELIFIILSSKTPPGRYTATFAALKARYPKADQLARAHVASVARILAPGGLGLRKAKQIVQIAKELRSRYGHVSLRHLAALPDDDAERLLVGLPGVGKKTARCVLLYSLNRAVFPVDTHCFRISRRLGWTGSSDHLTDGMADSLQVRIPPDLRHSLHVGFVCLGREICLPSMPRCNECPLRELCPTGTAKA